MSERRTECIKFRLSIEEKEALLHKAKQSSLSLSEYLRRCGLNRRLPSPRNTLSEVEIKQRVRKVLKAASKLIRRFNRNPHSEAVRKTVNDLSEQVQACQEVANKR
ncbi:plasmid mobilization protein [Coleofasciculus sp. E1-EBD-02]|uniref:plasmid mobilization protein n=1 Tax=Coleofasciculus sp. E1-EBD-02 TaxID=3068481 RepID=UPI0032F56281